MILDIKNQTEFEVLLEALDQYVENQRDLEDEMSAQQKAKVAAGERLRDLFTSRLAALADDPVQGKIHISGLPPNAAETTLCKSAGPVSWPDAAITLASAEVLAKDDGREVCEVCRDAYMRFPTT